MTTWSPERIAWLREAHARRRTAGDMAKELGTTRSAVLGAIWRLGLSARREKPVPGRSATRAVAPILAVQAPPAAAVPEVRPPRPRPSLEALFPPAAPFTHSVAIFDLKPGMCRFVHGEPRDLATFRYCGSPATEAAGGELAYCTACFERRRAPRAEARALIRATR